MSTAGAAPGGPGVSLRRADWRFLLPTPDAGAYRHLVLLGAPPGLAERLVDVGFAARVSRAIPAPGTADALVILEGAHRELARAARCLAPGGVLYCEVDRRRGPLRDSHPRHVRRVLQAAGLTQTGLYWVTPSFAAGKRYLPLDVPAALDWFFSTAYVGATPVRRLIGAAARLVAGRDSMRLSPLAPCYSVTAAAGADAGARPSSVLGDPSLPPRLRRDGLRPFLLTSGQDDGSRVAMLPFAPGGAAPLAVLKVSRMGEFNTNTEREQATLAEARERVGPALRESIPEPLALFRYGDLVVGAESCAPGHTLMASSARWRAPLREKLDDLRVAAGWLADFHRQAQLGRAPWDDEAVARWVERPLDAYARELGTTDGERRLFALARDRARVLADARVPLPEVWQHNDFGPWNVYRDGPRVTVIDWEFGAEREADRRGPPLCDLLYFVTHWYEIVARLDRVAGRRRAVRELFVERPASAAARAGAEAVAAYVAALEVDARFVPVLLVTTWAQRALDRVDRRRHAGEREPGDRAANPYADYVGALAGGAAELFAAGRSRGARTGGGE